MAPTSSAKAASQAAVHVFEFLRRKSPGRLPPIIVLAGSETFLRELAGRHLLEAAGAGGTATCRRWDGETANWRDVQDALRSHSLFDAAPPVVLIDQADPFVTANRGTLEAYVKQPAAGCLVLCPKSWLKTTRLYQLVQEAGWTVDCNLPMRSFGKSTKVDRKTFVAWLVERAKSVHRMQIDAQTVEYICDLSGGLPGVIDQEFSKLSGYAGLGERVTVAHVKEIGSGWRLRTTWELVDRIVEGDALEAIDQLQRLLQNGEEPIAVYGAISWTLRRFAAAARHSDWQYRRLGRRDLAESLRAAGFRNDYGQNRPATAERQLQQLGWKRCQDLAQRIMQVDLGLKGSHSSPGDARRLLEGLILSLSKQARSPALPR